MSPKELTNFKVIVIFLFIVLNFAGMITGFYLTDDAVANHRHFISFIDIVTLGGLSWLILLWE